jgi:hypothetical protein
LPAFDSINITVTAVSNDTTYPHLVYSQLFEAVLDVIPNASDYSIKITPDNSNYTYVLGQTVTVTLNLTQAIPAIDGQGKCIC